MRKNWRNCALNQAAVMLCLLRNALFGGFWLQMRAASASGFVVAVAESGARAAMLSLPPLGTDWR